MIPIFRKTPIFIGIALHDTRISIAKLKQTQKKILVEALSVLSLSLDALQEAVLLQTLKKWVEQHNAKHCSAALALPASQVIHKRIRMAACLDDLEREAEIAANLSHYLPGINESLNFDFLPIKQEGQEVELQLLAARSEQVAMYCRAAQNAGLNIKNVDVDAYAVVRAIHYIDPAMSSGIVLDLDAVSAQFFLLQNKKINSIYPIKLEKNNFLCQQIKRTLQFLSVTESIGTIEKILLTGELTHLAILKNVLQDECGIAVETLNSLGEKFDVQQDIAISTGLTALGLALRGWQHVRH